MKKKLLVAAVFTAACVTLSSCSDAGYAEYALESKCNRLEKRFDEILAAADDSCAKNSDCACYNPVSVKSHCGGVTGKKTAAELAKIWNEFQALRCPRKVHCRAWHCMPECFNGSCRVKIDRRFDPRHLKSR